MTRSSYYQELRALAQDKRIQYQVQTDKLNLRFMQRIYKAEGIKIDYWETRSRKIRAAYLCDDGDYSVMVKKDLPDEPKLFALAHELKHHYKDQQSILSGKIRCGNYNENELIEKGAEVFAAEFIYPEDELRLLLEQKGINEKSCAPEKVVEVKRACGAYVSYKFLVKRFEWFNLISKGSYDKIQFQKLEESIHGIPFYKQLWFRQSRRKKTV